MQYPMETGNNNKRMQLALWFSLQHDIRFLSHHDTMRLWQRAFTRAQFPIRYSCGFNPHLRMSLPLPRSVGMASQRELLLAEWEDAPLEPAQAIALQKELPAGIQIRQTDLVPAQVSYQPQWARYRLQLSEPVDSQRLRNRMDEFMQSQEWTVVRPAHGRHPKRNIHLRSCLMEMELQGNAISIRHDRR
jgi:radical SAM-linked protein